MSLFRTITDPFVDADALRRRRYGVIEMVDGRLVAIHLRPWPKIVSLIDVSLTGKRHHARRDGNRCLVYYNQPRACPNYLALVYVLSTRDCTLATFRGALGVLDDVARLKRTDAILCDAWNTRISDRLLKRGGWEAHKPSRWHRNFIRRFYGTFPDWSQAAGFADALTHREGARRV